MASSLFSFETSQKFSQMKRTMDEKMKRLLMNTALVSTMLFVSISSTVAHASEPLDSKIAAIEEKYEGQLAAIRAEGDQMASEAPDYDGTEVMLDMSVDVTWDTTSIIFDIPEVTMKTRELSLDLPQFRMKTKRIVWDNPEMKMVLKTVGKYPCFRGLKQYMCDIKTKVPELKMVRREAKIDIPEVFWARTSFKMDIPEFSMNRVEIKLDVPQFRAEEVDVKIDAYKARAEELAARAEALGRSQKDEIEAAVIEDLSAKKTEIALQFDTAISQLENAIETVRSHGANPAAVQSEDGTVNLVAQLDDLRAKRTDALSVISEKLSELAS